MTKSQGYMWKQVFRKWEASGFPIAGKYMCDSFNIIAQQLINQMSSTSYTLCRCITFSKLITCNEIDSLPSNKKIMEFVLRGQNVGFKMKNLKYALEYFEHFDKNAIDLVRIS